MLRATLPRTAVTLSCLLAIAMIGVLPASAKEAAAEAKTEKKKVTLAAFEVKGAFPETTSQVGLFGELEQSLEKTIARIDKAAQSDDIAGVVLRIRGPAIGRGKIDELRAAIHRARKSNTKVYADLQTATAADYMIACACDEIVMPSSGALMITGVRAEVMFYKNMLGKLGIKADFLQMGDFKGAAEPYMRSEMSPELRKQFDALIDDYYDQMIGTIAQDRKLDLEKVRALIDEGIFSADGAKQAGLIDRVAYEDEWKKSVQADNKADALTIIKDYGKKKVDTDFSGFSGMIKLMNLMMGNEPGSGGGRGDKIAVVYAVGAIMPGTSQQGLFGGSTLGSDTIVKALRTASKDDKVKAIVLRVDSPGGSALASDMIWREVVAIQKPIIASMGDVAASGGYYISMAANQIFAEPGTLTGSIGVVGGKLALGGMFDKVGVNTEVISRGKNSGVFSINEPFTPSERTVLHRLMSETYKQFTTKAAEGRKMKLDKLESLAQGKVYTGRQAKENGLVDQLGTLRDAVLAAKKAAGIPEDKKVELLILPKPTSIFEQMFGGPSIESRALEARLQAAVPELAAPLADLDALRRLFAQPVNAIVPYRIQIR